MKKIAPRIVDLCRLQAECCKTFGNPLRLLILACLADRERSVQELLALTGASKATHSQHTGMCSWMAHTTRYSSTSPSSLCRCCP